MTVTENVGTFMMCVVQMGISAVNYNVNIAPQDGTAIAGSGECVGEYFTCGGFLHDHVVNLVIYATKRSVIFALSLYNICYFNRFHK